MEFPPKVQLVKRKQSEQWYINFPSAAAQAMDFERGETNVFFKEREDWSSVPSWAFYDISSAKCSKTSKHYKSETLSFSRFLLK